MPFIEREASFVRCRHCGGRKTCDCRRCVGFSRCQVCGGSGWELVAKRH